MKPIALLALIASAPAAEIEKTYIADHFNDPMELAIAQDGDIYVIEREGKLVRIRPSTGGVFEVGQLPVSALRIADKDSPWAREDGLLGIALDPKFAQNQRLYLYYSHPDKMLNRLSRFVMKDGLLDLGSEKTLLDIPIERRDRVCHHGGAVQFGPDGLLYLSTGDNTTPFESDGFAPLDDREGREHANAMRSAGNTNDLRGKILRIRLTEDGYEIPAGNLFRPGTPKTRPEIYVMGCRNPFRISIDPKTKVVYWGEVGPDAQDSTEKGPRGHDEVNQAKGPGNFGWPFVIADNKPYPIVDFETGMPGKMTDPKAPENPSVSNTGLTKLPPAQPAMIWYPYAKSDEFPVMGEGGRNAMAGPVFYYDARRKYNLLDRADDHTLLTYEWMRGKVYKAKLGRDEKLESLEVLTGDINHPMDMEMADDGTVWVLEYGSEWWFGSDGRVLRLRPDDGNQPPVISVSHEGDTYTAEASDPEGKPVKVDWWLTEGADEKKLGSGLSIKHREGGSELRAVATDVKGEVSVARVSLVQEVAEPALTLELPQDAGRPGFGDELSFKITGAADPSKLVVRARYIPPTGHDSGGAQFSPGNAELITSKQCLACHQIDKTVVGPAYLDVAMRYHADPDALAKLITKLKAGGAGAWGEIPMPPQAAVSDEEADTIVKAILGLAEGMAESRGVDSGKLKLSSAPRGVGSGGAWEISAEAPGFTAARTRIPAK